MKMVFKLFKLQIDEANNLFKFKDVKKFAFTILKLFALVVIPTMVLYTFTLSIASLGVKINKEVLAIILLATQAVSLIFAIGNSISVLFVNKNNELLLSLPASPNQIFASKIIVIYIREFILNMLICLPFMITCGILGNFPAMFFWIIPLFLIILPVFPISIAVFLAIPVMKILNYFKRHLLLSVIMLLGIITVGIYFYVDLLSFFATSFNITAKINETIKDINEGIARIAENSGLFMKLAESMLSIKLFYWIFAFLGLSAVCFVGAVLLVRPYFIKMAMDGQDNSTRSFKKGKPYKKQKIFVTLLKKETLSVFRSPGYIFQYFLFTLLMPVIVVLYDNLLLMLVVNTTGQLMIAGAHVLIVAVLAMLSNIISASAISREGSNFYLMKTIPVNYYTQTAAKVVFNAIFTCGSVLLTGIVSFFLVSPVVAIFTTISVMLVAIGHICQSYDYDLKNPTLDWYDNSEISNINSNTTKSILWGIAIAVGMCMIIIMLSATRFGFLPWLVLFIASLAYCLRKIQILILRVYYQYERLEM